ncbi:MAG: hypothetical protein JXC32_07605 [Anaerolineae bacterium]|nr:hypothetical protein [Anaerolineae bacterium]
MRKNKLSVRFAGLVIAIAVGLTAPAMVAAAGGPPENRGMGVARGVLDANNPLDSDEQAVLVEFLLDEHKALATYESIMADFGAIAPFTSIARAEQQHIAALERVFTRYGIALPEIPTFDVPTFASPEEAAAAGAQAEIDNAALYDRLLNGIDNPDVVQVATRLRDASLNNHLPAFQAFADGTYVAGQGQGTQQMSGASSSAGLGRGRTNVGTPRGRGQGVRGLGSPLRVSDGTCLEQ